MNSKTMKAGLLDAGGEFCVTEIPIPVPAKDQLLIRVRACGVCMSEVGIWKGGRWRPYYPPYPEVLDILEWGFPLEQRELQYPLLMGHEMSGEIVETGKAVTQFKPGTRVTGFGFSGFAEYCLLPATHTQPLPSAIQCIHALGEPIACVYNAVQRAAVKTGDSVVIIGCGFMGLMMLQIVRLAKPDSVVVIDVRNDVLSLAKQMGADVAINSTQENVREELRKTIGPQGAQVAIEVSGKQETLDLATSIASVRGRVVIVGYHDSGPRTVDMALWNCKGLDVINAHERDPQVYLEGMRGGIRLLEEGCLQMEPLITHLFSLDEIGTSFHTAAQKPSGFIKAVIKP